MKVAVNRQQLNLFAERYNVIETALGGVVGASIEFCGHDVTNELAGSTTQTEAFLIWALGRKPRPLETRIIDTLICLNIYPDIRIWSIRTAAYAAACGAPLSSCFGAAHIAANARIFGLGPVLECSRFFSKLYTESVDRSVEEITAGLIAKRVFFPGFGRPLIQGPDERCLRLSKLLQEWDYTVGGHMKMLNIVVQTLLKSKGLFPNYAAPFVCLLLDPPFEFDDTRLSVLLHYLIALPSYLPACEIKDFPSGTPILPMKTSDILFKGKPKRTL